MIIKKFTEYDIMINKSFRDLLCLEGLLIGVISHNGTHCRMDRIGSR